jgi:hypothetical protein
MAFARFFRAPSKLGCWVLLFVGFCLFGGAVVSAIQTEVFLGKSVSVAGKVVSLRSKVDYDGSTTYAPVFSFTAGDGRSYTVSSNAFANPADFSPGQSVTVLYVKDLPAEVRIDTFYQVWGMAEVLAIIAAGFIAMGTGFLLYRHRRDRRGMQNPLASPVASSH